MKEGLVNTVNIVRTNRFWQIAGVRLQKVPKPKIRRRLDVITDGLRYRKVCLTGEASIVVLAIKSKVTKQKQAERQGFVKTVEVADELVVVKKSVPEKS